MNSLSWLIYFAEVFGRLSPLISVLGAIFLGGGLIILGISAAAHADARSNLRWKSLYPEEQSQERMVFWMAVMKAWPRKLIAIGIAGLVLSTFLPRSHTLYMIAASELGEKVVTAPETREMLDDLRMIVSKQLKSLRDDK